jgi:hypothetical protein
MAFFGAPPGAQGSRSEIKKRSQIAIAIRFFLFLNGVEDTKCETRVQGSSPAGGADAQKKRSQIAIAIRFFFGHWGQRPRSQTRSGRATGFQCAKQPAGPTNSRGRFASYGWGALKVGCPPAKRSPKGMGLQAQWERRQARQGAQRPRARSHESGGVQARQGAQRPSARSRQRRRSVPLPFVPSTKMNA